METNLLGYVMERLQARRIALREVARGSGVPYDTLKKIASGRTPDPGVLHVQRLAQFFCTVGEADTPVTQKEAA